MYDVDYRECPLAAVDTAYPMTQQGADTPMAFIVPTTASRITKILIGCGATDAGADTIVGMTCGVHLYGGGIGVSEGWFAGNVVAASGAAATSGGFQFGQPMVYRTNIPVKAGGTFNADAFVWGEDVGAFHMILAVEYDGEAGLIVDGDVREVDIGAAANTLVTLANRGAAVAEGDFRPNYNKIVEIVFGAAPDPTGDAAATLNFMPTLHLSGGGLLYAGNYKFIGASGMVRPDTDVAGDMTAVQNLTRYVIPNGIPIKRGDAIRAQAQNIESVQAGHAVVGFLYGN